MIRIAAILAAAILTNPAFAADWPQWMGPSRNGVWEETGIVEEFPVGGLKKLWSTPVAGGYSGPAVVDGKVFVFDFIKMSGEIDNNPSNRTTLGGKERIQCLNAKSGEQVWAYEYPCDYAVSYACGPRCTPTVAGGKVYALGTMGNLHCLDAKTGKVVWENDFKTDFRAETPMWGFSNHPLVYEDKLFCIAGGPQGLAVAFDKDTGKVLWQSLNAKEVGYCPPTMIKNGSEDQLLVWHATELNALNPNDGQKRWSVKLEPRYGMAINAPQQEGNLLFAGGIGGQSVLLDLNSGASEPTEVWRGKKETGLYSANATPLIYKGMLYGCCSAKGVFRGVDLKSGRRLWETEAMTHGKPHGTSFVVRNGDRFFSFSETGELILAQFTRQNFQEISRAQLIEPTGEAFGRKVVWSHPAFADRCIFVRNDKEVACFSLAK